MADVEDIIAMKMDVVSRGGRMKDFWDLHELLDRFSIDQMISLHEERYPNGDDKEVLKGKLIDFSSADDDFVPMCLRGKHWELIKLDFIEVLSY